MKKILLVDDDTDLLLLLRHFLNSKGYSVTVLEEGSDVTGALDTVNPDLLLLDINIGPHDGRDICRKIKANHAYDHIPVVMFSALVREADALAGCEADGYIAKPISTPSLLLKIKSLMAA